MTQKKNHSLRSIFFGFLLSSLALTSLYGQEGDPVKGKALFNANCAACHQLDKKMTGPALRYVETRLSEDEGLDREWLNAWIRNSNSVIKSGTSAAAYNAAAEPRSSRLCSFSSKGFRCSAVIPESPAAESLLALRTTAKNRFKSSCTL